MLILVFLALQGMASLLLPSGRRWLGPDLGRQALVEVLDRTVRGWISSYRGDLEADPRRPPGPTGSAAVRARRCSAAG